MKKNLFLVLSACLAIILCGCDGLIDPGNSSLSLPDFQRLDLSGAAALALVPSSAASRGDSESSTYVLAKVTAEGAIVEATCYDGEGNSIGQTSGFAPNAIYPVNEDYVVACFNLCATTETVSIIKDVGYLIRNSDGAVFSLENIGYPHENIYFQNEPDAFQDGAGNIYLLVDSADSSTKAVWKIATSDLANLTATRVSYVDDTVDGFIVDEAGDVLYRTAAGKNRMMIAATGGFSVLPGRQFWLGQSGELFAAPESYGTYVRRLSVDGGTVTSSVYGTESDSFMFWLDPCVSFLFRNGSRILRVSEASMSGQYTELYNENSQPRTIEALPSLNIQRAIAGDGAYYIAGTDSTDTLRIIKVNADDYSYTDLVTVGLFDSMYQMFVDTDGSVTFNALRLADGKKILAKVDTSGTLTVLNESMDSEIVSLVRIF